MSARPVNIRKKAASRPAPRRPKNNARQAAAPPARHRNAIGLLELTCGNVWAMRNSRASCPRAAPPDLPAGTSWPRFKVWVSPTPLAARNSTG